MRCQGSYRRKTVFVAVFITVSSPRPRRVLAMSVLALLSSSRASTIHGTLGPGAICWHIKPSHQPGGQMNDMHT